MSKLEEGVARVLLARDGISMIWEVHIAADTVYRVGNLRAAYILLDIADAAETIWLGGVDPAKPDTQRVGKECTRGATGSPVGNAGARCCSPPSSDR